MAKFFNLGSLFNDDKNLKDMLGRIDTLVGTMAKQKRPDSEIDLSDNALREILNTVNSENDDGNSYQKLLEGISISSDRLSRYKIYDEIYSSVQLLKRITAVYISNCLQQDVLTGTILTVTDSENAKLNLKNKSYYSKFCKDVIQHYSLETTLKDRILQHVLRYGDHYIELIDLKNDISDIPGPNISSKFQPQFLTESSLREMEHIMDVGGVNKQTIFNETIDKLYTSIIDIDETDSIDIDMIAATKLFKEEVKSNVEDGIFDPTLLNRILLRFHKPENIVALTTKYDTILGYVEIKERQKAESMPGVGIRFANVIQQLSSMTGKSKGDNTVVIQRLVNKIITNMVKKLNVSKDDENSGKSNHAINKEYEELLHTKLGDDLFYMIKKIFIESNPDANLANKSKKLSVRFIPKDRIVQFCHNPIEFHPYGTSILDALVYPGKLYLLSQLTNVVSKLSRAALIRKWTIETGPREHHSGLIQKLKREFRNQRVSVDDLMSFKSVPRILSDFKDIILLSKKGQKFVDVDIQNMHDANVKVADLEDTRRELIALSGVPGPFLGYSDVVELRYLFSAVI